MMYVTMGHPRSNEEISFGVHITEDLSFIDLNKVKKVQCDSDELGCALHILGRPFSKSVMVFFGDNAKEIIANWK